MARGGCGILSCKKQYTGWFNVYGVIQPLFIDIDEHWAEVTTNRMNGLGIIEGYPGEGLVRTARLDRNITRAEFISLLFRLLNINPDNLILETYDYDETHAILEEYFENFAEIPKWVVEVLAASTKAGLVDASEGVFLANEPITRLEAAVMVSKAFKILEQYQPIDLTQFKDAKDIPDWAQASLAEDVIEGYPDSTFRPDNFITRAEALTVLMRLFIIGMGL
ncbi:MAG: S-layer homology domain-containing protein [Clostridia bacterium]|nr:S-layer homology domain-containing protein [Clostridia bacterium]